MASAAVVFSAPSPEPAQALADSAWRVPVPGGPVRPYRVGRHPFERGAHRGVDLAARTGDPVVAACAGQVVFAGAVAGARVVTVSCQGWRVTHLPLRDVRVTAGQVVRTGELLASFTADPAHAGLHVGVRRAGYRFGYVDPWPLLSRARHPPSMVPGKRVPSPRGDWRPSRRPVVERRPLSRPAGDRRLSRSPVDHRRRSGGPLDARRPARAPVDSRRSSPEPLGQGNSAGDRLAPPAVWIGLAILLAGAAQTRPGRRRLPMRLRAKESATGTR